MPTTDHLESFRVALGLGLALCNVAVWLGVWLERDAAPQETKDRGWRILVRGLAAEAALALLLLATDTTISNRQRAQISEVNLRAAQLGLAVDGLPAFVMRRVAEVRRQQAGLKVAMDSEVARNNAAMLELERSTADLRRAREDAVTAAAVSKKDLADMAAALAEERMLRDRFAKLVEPRQLNDAQATAVLAALKPYRGQPVTVMTGGSLKEPTALAVKMVALLKQAGWLYDEPVGVFVGAVGGLLVDVNPRASSNARNAAKALSDALRAQGLENKLSVEDGGQKPGPDTELITLVVGQRE